MIAPQPWSSAQKVGDFKRPVGYILQQLEKVSHGWAVMPVSHSWGYSHPRGREIDFGTKGGSIHFACCNHCIRTKGRALAFPESCAEVSNCSKGARRWGDKVTRVASPVQFLNTPMQGGEPLAHDCLQAIEQVCAVWPDLQDAPTEDPATEFFTDGNSLVQEEEKPVMQ